MAQQAHAQEMASQCPNGLTRHYCNESCTWEHSNAAGVHSWLSDVQTILFVLASNWNGRLGLSLALCMRIVLSCEVNVCACGVPLHMACCKLPEQSREFCACVFCVRVCAFAWLKSIKLHELHLLA